MQPNYFIFEGSESFQRLKAILAAPHLLRDLPRASHKAQTFGLEAFHSLLIHFAPKSSKFTYEGMLARTKIAALHYNENSGRDILTDPSGAERISQRFSRGEKEWTVVPVKQNAGYGEQFVLKNCCTATGAKKQSNTYFSTSVFSVQILHKHYSAHSFHSKFQCLKKWCLVRLTGRSCRDCLWDVLELKREGPT